MGQHKDFKFGTQVGLS